MTKTSKIMFFAGFLTLLNTFTALPMQERNIHKEWEEGTYHTTTLNIDKLPCFDCQSMQTIFPANYFAMDTTNAYIIVSAVPLCSKCIYSNKPQQPATEYIYDKDSRSLLDQSKKSLTTIETPDNLTNIDLMGTFSINITRTGQEKPIAFAYPISNTVFSFIKNISYGAIEITSKDYIKKAQIYEKKYSGTSSNDFTSLEATDIDLTQPDDRIIVPGNYRQGSANKLYNINVITTKNGYFNYLTVIDPTSFTNKTGRSKRYLYHLKTTNSGAPYFLDTKNLLNQKYYLEKTFVSHDGTIIGAFDPITWVFTIFQLLNKEPGLKIDSNKTEKFAKVYNAFFKFK